MQILKIVAIFSNYDDDDPYLGVKVRNSISRRIVRSWNYEYLYTLPWIDYISIED